MKTSPQLETSPVKELVRAGHELAAAMGADTPLIEIAKLVSRLASELDVQLARSNALAAENAGLMKANDIALKILNDEETMVTSLWASSIQEVEVKIPATSAFLAEVRAQGVEMFAQKCDSKAAQSLASDIHDNWKLLGEHASDFAAQLRKGAQS